MIAAPVSVDALVVSSDQIRSLIINSFEELAAESGTEIEVTVLRLKDIELNDVDDPVMNIDIPSDGKLRPRMPVRVEFCDSTGTVVRRFQFSALVKEFRDVAVVNTDLKRGDPITDDVIEITRVDISGLRDYYEDLSQLEGKQANRILRSGTVLSERYISSISDINRGEKVCILARIGMVTVSAEGTARQDGNKDEVIRVYNEVTRKTLRCRVIDAKTVLLEH